MCICKWTVLVVVEFCSAVPCRGGGTQCYASAIGASPTHSTFDVRRTTDWVRILSTHPPVVSICTHLPAKPNESNQVVYPLASITHTSSFHPPTAAMQQSHRLPSLLRHISHTISLPMPRSLSQANRASERARKRRLSEEKLVALLWRDGETCMLEEDE